MTPTHQQSAADAEPAVAAPWLAKAIRDELAVAVIDAMPDATAVLDSSGVIVAVNNAWRMFALDNGGSEAATGVGVNYLDVCRRSAQQGCDEAGRVAEDLSAVLAGDYVEAEVEYPCPSPTVRRWFMLRTNRLMGEESGAVLSHVNITRRKMAEEQLVHSASHDPLTGLANRRLLEHKMARALAAPFGGGEQADVGVLFIDLDGFKAINDTWGHAAGDEVLLTVASRLRALVGVGATVARLGGDEFVMLGAPTNAESLSTLAVRVEESLAQPMAVHGNDVAIGASIGLYLAAVGEDTATVLHEADQAMYLAKQARQQRR